ncbi:hypothetical protein DPMN_115343 [Dreissena polymorpha]|uniref:C3H1-type domain-containing protein n=2 Tax=Dreissena polymorpha TaxID=45954 RepID=A0A9D4QT98_DREPO|nr:hypothetical protein DPMN_115343 [Dreissena polymorpha]
MIIEEIEKLKEWLTNSLAPICEADPGALAKYVVALVKKDKPRDELKDCCLGQLEVFLQTNTENFVESLFEVLDSKSYIPIATETTPTQDEISPTDPDHVATPEITGRAELPDSGLPTSEHQVSSTSKSEIVRQDEELKEAFPIGEKRRRSRSRSRSLSPRGSQSRERKFDERRLGYSRAYQPRRRSTSPRGPQNRGPRPRSPYRRRSPYRPIRRSSRSPLPRGRGRGRSRSRSWSRSPRRSPRLSRSRSRSPGGRFKSRSRSPGGRFRSRSPRRARSPRGRSPLRHSVSPRFRSRSPRVRSPGRSLSASPRRSRSVSPLRKVRRQSADSRGPTPTQENGLLDSAAGPPDPQSSISVVSHGTARYGEPLAKGLTRCRDYDEKGFCVRGDLCPFDHGSDPVIVESVAQYPPPGPPPMMGGPPPPPGHINVGLPPPGFFTNRPPVPHIHVRPDFYQEPYNPEAPAISRPVPPPYWPGAPDVIPPFMKNMPPPPIQRTDEQQRLPVHARLGNRELINLTVKREVKEEEEEEEVPSSSTRTVIAPKEEPLQIVSSAQPHPPGITAPPLALPAPGVMQSHAGFTQQNRFHPYQRFPGPRKPFDFNRVGGYRRPDQTNCTLEVRKIPKEFNNIAKLNEHFARFGTLTNIQVMFEGDPEAALVSYSNNVEALACYKCSEPVFNNRFIKVFWHQKKDNSSQEQSPVSTTSVSSGSGEEPVGEMKRHVVIPPPSKMSLNNNLTKKSTPDPAAHGAETDTKLENDAVYTSSVGTVAKQTPYVPAALKAKPVASQGFVSPTAVGAANFVSRMEKVKQIEAMKTEAALKKLELAKHKQDLLEKQIEQQKKLITALEKKDLTDANKKTIMETLKTLTNSIDKLRVELGGTLALVKSPEQAKREILDVELELMTKSSSGEDTAQLKRKLEELTQVANSMGLIGRGRGRGAVARGRATKWVASGVSSVPSVGLPGRGRGRGLFGRGAVAVRTLDRRPKVLEVTGWETEEKQELTTHLNSLRSVEKVEVGEESTCAIVTFKTRRDAEMGILHGSKFKNKTLKMVWHIPKPDFSRSISSTSADTDDQEEIDEEALLGGGDDDEDEDSNEDRAWRHRTSP